MWARDHLLEVMPVLRIQKKKERRTPKNNVPENKTVIKVHDLLPM